MVPRSLLYADVPPRLVVLYGVLDDLARNHPAVVVTQAMLAATLTVSRRTIQRWLAELERAGYLATSQPGNGALAYELLSRPRVGDNYPAAAVQVRQDWRTYAPAGASGLAHLPAAALSIRAREEKEHLAPLPSVDDRRAPWCGICDARTRLLEHPQTGQPSRCPRCHPASTATPPF